MVVEEGRGLSGNGIPGGLVYLIRHADAGDKRSWPGSDTARPLTEFGWRQARGVTQRLLRYPIARILSSPARRCEQTVALLARQRCLPVELHDDLAVEGDVDAVLRLLDAPGLQAAALCTHGELIGQAVRRLLAAGMRVSSLTTSEPRWAKGSVWVLERGGADRRGNYLEPLALPPALAWAR
jgi:8-oxo-dGTP diphosphatase